MYLSATVKVPEIPGKITRRKMGTNVYVLFEVGRVYDPKRQFNVPQRVTIGKLVSEADNTQMQPNEKFLELFPEQRPVPQEQAPKQYDQCRNLHRFGLHRQGIQASAVT